MCQRPEDQGIHGFRQNKDPEGPKGQKLTFALKTAGSASVLGLFALTTRHHSTTICPFIDTSTRHITETRQVKGCDRGWGRDTRSEAGAATNTMKGTDRSPYEFIKFPFTQKLQSQPLKRQRA